MSAVSQRDRDIWRAAITLANNLCVARSDATRGDDGPTDIIREAADCADAISAWLSPTDGELVELFREAGVHVERDFLGEPLNSGDGVYRP